jgi:protein O-mannosyl-transferase
VSWARRDALVAAGVVLSALVLHAGVIGHGFVNWDDNRFITANPLFAAGGWNYVRAALTRVQFEAYHPLHLLSYLPDRWLWPRHPAGFHAVNLALFGLDVLLLFRLARRHAGLGAAAGAALLLAAHPLCVEPVAWVSGRKDLLAAAFFVGVLLLEDRRDAADGRGSPAGLALFAAALLSKTATLCLPPLIWGWLLWMRRTTARAPPPRARPYALLGLLPAMAVVTIWRQHDMIGRRPVAAPIDVLATLATYARRTIWPSDLAAVYPFEMPTAVPSALLAGAFLIAVVLLWRRLPHPARFAVFAFPVALLPVANLVPLTFRFADRYAFLALAILVPPVAIGLEVSFRAGRALRAVAIGAATAAIVALAAVTFGQTASWASSTALWARASAAQPEAFMARLKYGETLSELHDWASARNEFQAAVRLQPRNSHGYAGLFVVYASRAEEQGRLPVGTAQAWLTAFGKARENVAAFDALIAEVPRPACPECADTVLLMRLRRWPKPDEELLRAARAALEGGAPDAALVILDGVADKASPEWSALVEAARAPQGTR